MNKTEARATARLIRYAAGLGEPGESARLAALDLQPCLVRVLGDDITLPGRGRIDRAHWDTPLPALEVVTRLLFECAHEVDAQGTVTFTCRVCSAVVAKVGPTYGTADRLADEISEHQCEAPT